MATMPTACYKCNRFGQPAKKCRMKHSCTRFGGQDHNSGDCRNVVQSMSTRQETAQCSLRSQWESVNTNKWLNPIICFLYSEAKETPRRVSPSPFAPDVNKVRKRTRECLDMEKPHASYHHYSELSIKLTYLPKASQKNKFRNLVIPVDLLRTIVLDIRGTWFDSRWLVRSLKYGPNRFQISDSFAPCRNRAFSSRRSMAIGFTPVEEPIMSC